MEGCAPEPGRGHGKGQETQRTRCRGAFSSSRVRKGGAPKCGRSHRDTVSSAEAPIDTKPEPGWGPKGEPVRGLRSDKGRERGRPGEVRGKKGEAWRGAHQYGPTLSGSSSSSAGRGRRARPHPRPGRSVRLSPATAAAHAPCVVPATGRPGGVGGGDGSGTAGLPHLLPPPPLRLTPGSSSPHRRRLPAPPPLSPPPDEPIRPGSAPHVTAQLGPSPRVPSLAQAGRVGPTVGAEDPGTGSP